MKIAYLVNQYPKVSHSFIRREIQALEACGVTIARFSIRSCIAELVDEADKLELEQTKIVLDSSVVTLLGEFLHTLITRPLRLLKALGMTLQLGQRSRRGILRHLAYLVEACALLRWFSEAGVEHVHAHFGTNSTTVAMLCHMLDGPSYSFTVHGPEEFDMAEEIGLPEKITHAAFVVAISSFGRSQLYRWCEFSQWQKIHVVRCGVDRSFLSLEPVPVPTAPVLVCVGRLCEQKGQLLLLDAASRLFASGLQFKLVLVGDGPLRPTIEAFIARHGLESSVEITGWASNAEVRQHLLSAKAMVLPSFAEGLPVVIMEALALHRPVITTYVAGIPELVEPDVCGWLIPSGSVAALTVAIRKALTVSVETLEKMGTLGAERVLAQHNADLEARKLAELFRCGTEASQTTPLLGILPEGVSEFQSMPLGAPHD